MMAEHPPALGAGPGTFVNLFKVFRQDDNPAIDWFAHNDFLETRITFGLVGAAFIYAGLLLCPASALCRGGLPVPPYFLALMSLGLVGGLVHARFDWVFESHALLFLGVILCGTIAASSIRAADRRR
jgi:O-antigen ligase